MPMQKYIVLKTSQLDFGDVFSFPAMRGAPMAPGAGLGATELSVAVEDVSRSDVADMRRDPDVVGIAPPMPTKLVEPIDIPGLLPASGSVTWGVKAVGADQSSFSGSGITVAVLDTGIDASHPAFNGVNVVEKDFSGEGNGDRHGHGTHCAGTIFGRNVGGTRFGIAQGVNRALIGKVLGQQGGSTVAIFEAIIWALNEGANVVSMSLGSDYPGFVKRLEAAGFPTELATSKALEGYRANVRLYDKIAELVRARGLFGRGCLIVAAAGNESRRNVNPDFEISVAPPATADGILSVGAVGETGDIAKPLEVAFFSNTGPNVAAPGVGILSAKAGGGLVSMNGTSMATPHVAGIAALWAEKLLAETGRLSSDDLAAFLIGRARRLPSLDPMDIGAGLVTSP